MLAEREAALEAAGGLDVIEPDEDERAPAGNGGGFDDIL